MKVIASQPYVIVNRTIEWNKQHYIEEQRYLHLYEQEITAGSERFRLQDVLDVSYRILSPEDWFLYLHTNQGVFSYNVKTHPGSFVDSYKKLKWS